MAAKRSITPKFLALAACGWLGAADTTAQAPPRAQAGTQTSWCAESGALGLLGFDTSTGTLLLTPSSPAPYAPSLLLVDLEGRQARAMAAGKASLFAGSAGPGPILALTRCGQECVQAQRWGGEGFVSVGEPLPAPSATTLFTTYDRAGFAWLITHQPAAGRWLEATAYRLEEGRWQLKGRHMVQGALAWGVMPAPGQSDGVVSGTGLFSASAAPVTWVHGFPTLPPGREGQIAPLGSRGAAYFAADGAVYASPDAGASWQGSKFRPWGREPSEIWTYGSDFLVDLPLGTLGEPLPIAWFDRRGGRTGRIYLTELATSGGFQIRGELPTELDIEGGEAVELVHLLAKDGGTWVLLSDCFERNGKATVALVVTTLAGPEPPLFLEIQ